MSKRFNVVIMFLAFVLTQTQGQDNKMLYKNWQREVRQYTPDFFCTQEAKRIGDNILLYQHTTGGWPKNIYFPAVLTDEQKSEIISHKNDVNESTIDNNATTVEIKYLANLYKATNNPLYKKAVIDGIDYILKAQYKNGGWPQFYPRPEGYYTQITYNDNAMVNVMLQLRDIYENKEPYNIVDKSIKERAKKAFDKGIECILNTQVKQNGELTVWCAQHDKNTLLPCKARAYELPSLSGAESDEIVLLLMSLPNPSDRIKNSIEWAIKWFNIAQINDLKRETFTNSEGKRDYRMVKSNESTPLWARFYELETNKPFFSDRDGIKKYDISEIGYERRNGYSWYNSNGNKVLKAYKKWKEINKK